MDIECSKCSKKLVLNDLKVKSISIGEEFSDDDWFLDLQFEEENNNLIIKNYHALCDDCRNNKYTQEMKKY